MPYLIRVKVLIHFELLTNWHAEVFKTAPLCSKTNEAVISSLRLSNSVVGDLASIGAIATIQRPGLVSKTRCREKNGRT